MAACMTQFCKAFKPNVLGLFARQSRSFSATQPSQLTGVLLDNKSLVKVSGNDSVHFLNGLVTNDINLFHHDSHMSAIYCMMLNVKGRVLYDLIFYKLSENMENPQFLLECDSQITDNILKTFKLYKLRSKVELHDVSERYSSWAVLEEDALETLEQRNSSDACKPLVAVRDPRLAPLGARLVLPKEESPSKYYNNVKDSLNRQDYDMRRVRLGVSEGVKDVEPGVPLPLEYNITELHGVSYQKGCYIGQELTARTHHTGVIRKRIMPVKLNTDEDLPETLFEKDASIKTTSGKSAGKLKSIYGNIGLGLLRLDTVRKADGLTVVTSDGASVSVEPDWPSWWD